MRSRDKPGGPGPKGEKSKATETIVLGSTESNTPAKLVVDADGLLDIDRLSSTNTVPETPDPDPHPEPEPEPDAPRRNPIAGILKLLRKPESRIVQAYQQSSVRQSLHNKFEWYRDMEGESHLHNKLEDLYGGQEKPVRRFVRKNVVVSLTALGVLAYLTFQYLSYSPENYRYTETTTASANNPGAKVKPASETKRETDLSQVLNHCAVTEELREFYAGIENNKVRRAVIKEVSGFIKVYSGSAIEQWYADQETKRDNTISQINAVVPRVRQFSTRMMDEYNKLSQQRSGLIEQLQGMSQASKYSLRDINTAIHIRTDLENVETLIAMIPTPRALQDLDDQVLRLEKIASGELTVTPTVISQWALEMSRHDRAALVESVDAIVENDIFGIMEKLAPPAPEAQLFKMQILSVTLHHLGDLIAKLSNSSNYYEAQVGKHQHATNSKLKQLVTGKDGPQADPLDYTNCLTPLKGEQIKLTLR